MAEPTGSGRRRRVAASGRASIAKWSRAFLAELAASSNVAGAARKAGVCTATVYEARRTDPEFYQQWQLALFEGYELLEMALVRRLRVGELKPGAGSKRPARSYDNASALRLLAAHKDSAARQRAMRSREDTEAIILSINAKLERMRQRRLAITAETQTAAQAEAGDASADGG